MHGLHPLLISGDILTVNHEEKSEPEARKVPQAGLVISFIAVELLIWSVWQL